MLMTGPIQMFHLRDLGCVHVDDCGCIGEYETPNGKVIWKTSKLVERLTGFRWTAYGHDDGDDSCTARSFATLQGAAEHACLPAGGPD